MRKLLENLELVLTAAGLVVVFIAHELFQSEADTWRVPAITAIAVGVIHGVIFWLVRRRQRRIRRETLGELESMLKDVINNQLCIISFTAESQKPDPHTVGEAKTRISSAVQRIHTALDSINEESLASWKSKYGDPADRDRRASS